MADAEPTVAAPPPSADETRIPDSLPPQPPSANGTKRKASAEPEIETDDVANHTGGAPDTSLAGESDKPLTKNQQKKLKRQKLHEEWREERKHKRKEARGRKQERKREEKEKIAAAAVAAGQDPQEALKALRKPVVKSVSVPVAIVVDCDFEEYMRENEQVSMASQVVRCYSQVKKAEHVAHLFISSWKGKLKERFETTMRNVHKQWKGVHIVEGDFVEAARLAKEVMAGEKGGQIYDIIKPSEGEKGGVGEERDEADSTPIPEDEEDVDRSVVYLTSDSPYTLERLEANTTYVIGGIVDKNREKGLCYKIARKRKVRTAKLPIGEFMAMQSRYVLTTNQVVEIMVKWLDCGDWGKAFMEIIPARKGGVLKVQEGAESNNGDASVLEDEGEEQEPAEPSAKDQDHQPQEVLGADATPQAPAQDQGSA